MQCVVQVSPSWRVAGTTTAAIEVDITTKSLAAVSCMQRRQKAAWVEQRCDQLAPQKAEEIWTTMQVAELKANRAAKGSCAIFKTAKEPWHFFSLAPRCARHALGGQLRQFLDDVGRFLPLGRLELPQL
jgi:hypothetical protein